MNSRCRVHREGPAWKLSDDNIFTQLPREAKGIPDVHLMRRGPKPVAWKTGSPLSSRSFRPARAGQRSHGNITSRREGSRSCQCRGWGSPCWSTAQLPGAECCDLTQHAPSLDEYRTTMESSPFYHLPRGAHPRQCGGSPGLTPLLTFWGTAEKSDTTVFFFKEACLFFLFLYFFSFFFLDLFERRDKGRNMHCFTSLQQPQTQSGFLTWATRPHTLERSPGRQQERGLEVE